MPRMRYRRQQGTRAACDLQRITLDRLAVGQTASVVAIPNSQPNLLRKLMAFGILPGVELTMLQRTPTYVIRVGFTDVALGHEIASLIELETYHDS